jgi:hypothetical protein
MPKLIDYPRASMKSAMELADAVDSLGGACTLEMAAERLGKKVGGAFQAQISAGTKYQLLGSKSQKLSVSQLYREIKLAYDDGERAAKLRQSLLSVPVFQAVWVRFAGKELPLAHFEKLLIREFQIPDDWGSRVEGYFLEGARMSGLLDENNRLRADDSADEANDRIESLVPLGTPTAVSPSPSTELIEEGAAIEREAPPTHQTKQYVVTIKGPGMNSSMEIHEPEDLMIVQAMLKKIERALEISTSTVQ